MNCGMELLTLQAPQRREHFAASGHCSLLGPGAAVKWVGSNSNAALGLHEWDCPRIPTTSDG